MTRYRTIVVDPPWPIHSHGARTPATNGNWNGKWTRSVAQVPYQTMAIDEICALPVGDLVAQHGRVGRSFLRLWWRL